MFITCTDSVSSPYGQKRRRGLLVCKHVTYKYIGVPYPIPWKIPYVPYRPNKVIPLSKFPLVTQ
jgi:hypothetical protein